MKEIYSVIGTITGLIITGILMFLFYIYSNQPLIIPKDCYPYYPNGTKFCIIDDFRFMDNSILLFISFFIIPVTIICAIILYLLRDKKE